MSTDVGGEETSFLNEESFPRCVCQKPLCDGECQGVPVQDGLCEDCLEDRK